MSSLYFRRLSLFVFSFCFYPGLDPRSISSANILPSWLVAVPRPHTFSVYSVHMVLQVFNMLGPIISNLLESSTVARRWALRCRCRTRLAGYLLCAHLAWLASPHKSSILTNRLSLPSFSAGLAVGLWALVVCAPLCKVLLALKDRGPRRNSTAPALSNQPTDTANSAGRHVRLCCACVSMRT